VWSYGVEVGAFIDSLSQVDNKVAVLDVVRKEITLLEEIFSPVLEGYTPVFIDEQFDPELDEYDGPGEFAEDGPRHSNGVCVGGFEADSRPFCHP
jgi:hypothetical protein